MDRSNPMVRCFLAVFGHSWLCSLNVLNFGTWFASRILRPPIGRAFSMGMAVAFLIAPTVCFGDPYKAGSWFVEAVKYHVSAHGQVSCQDCHSDIKRGPTHPNPADVTRSLTDFFNSGTCFSCHDGDSIKINLEKGLHGGKPVKKTQDYSNCIACHDPHYQPPLNKKGVSGFQTAAQGRELCGECHEKKDALPPSTGEDSKCLECHKAVDPRDREKTAKNTQFCLGCHGAKGTFAGAAVAVPLIDTIKHVSKGHNRLDCMSCHSEAARFEHHRHGSVSCHQCHTPHHEATIHDAHATVSCQACHLVEVKPKRDNESGKVVWEKPARATAATRLNLARPEAGTKSCQRCHHTGNQVSAAAMVLPAKSIICMPCHAATFSAKDTSSVLALLGFGLGMCVVASVWLSGAAPQRAVTWIDIPPGSGWRLFSRSITLLKALYLDGLLQRRLFEQSRSRWVIHGLIFWPFLLRFGWGLTALVGSLALPSEGWVWSMLDKNNPLTAFVFDLTGVMLIAGAVLAVLRKRGTGASIISGLPDRDSWAVGLLGAIVIVGFILEGARIALTGAAGGARFAFAGWTLSLLWRGTHGLSQIYGYMWYLHAFLTGAFLVYLPFSNMFHLLMAPVVIVLNAVDSSHHSQNHPPHRTH